VSSGSSNLSSNYTYDTADRLTTATIGSNTYSYGFGVQNSSCGVGSNMNSVSGNSSNRTSQTINGTTTTYCYNYADQLVSSSDPSESGDTYDSHGDLTRIGTGASLVRFYYDAEDRNTGIEQYDNNGNGYGMYYGRDPLGRIVGRYENNIANWNWTDSGNDINYDYSDSSDNPSYARSNYTWAITAEYVQLPGGVTVTIYPQQSSQASEYGYNLTNLHGDTFLTTDGTGSNTSSGTGPANAFIYDPFGNPISGNSDPANTDRASYGYEGRSLKITETDFTGTPIQMGARVYLPALGRFTTMDPVSGGNANTYMYPADPINHNDVSGQCIGPFILLLPACIMVLTAAVDYFGTGGGGGAVESGAADLSDQLVIQEVKSNPSVGEQIMKGSLKDPAFPETDGWAKMQYTHEPLTQNARRVTVHYFYNTTTKVVKNVKIMR
ncbi:MAG: RHS repeat-associated core domain-containing protein, partial [Candidatus Korobacteraceae bacterium]